MNAMNAWKSIPAFTALLVTGACLLGCSGEAGLSARKTDQTAGEGPPLAAAKGSFFRDISYTQWPPQLSHRLDLAVPEGPGPFPVVVWIHGGAWMQGDKFDCPAAFLVDHGFAVASINYRLSAEAPYPAQILDCKAAVRYLRSQCLQYHLDPERIGVWGQSAGGHLAAMLGTTSYTANFGPADESSAVSAVCDWCGPADLMTLSQQCGPHWGLDWQSDKAPHYVLVRAKDSRNLLNASPVTYVHSTAPPFLIMHGDSDNVVPLAQSEELADALKLAGVDTTFIVVKGAGHNLAGQENFNRVLTFFNEKLKSAKTQQ